ncbi:MAG: NCS2 family permease [Candidatus Latescibacteria bacterium]|nr:NCS2 family permease [Candidatus Latescibacterota bacterium]
MLEKLFKLKENGTTVQTEIIAGATTFLSMAYIIFFQPALLSQAGMDFGSVMMATCIASAIACLVMAFLANYPIALAPGMGENFYFVFTVVIGMGIAWEKALGAVFISGVLFMVLTLFRIREMIIDSIPSSLKNAIPAAIGLFITFIGLTYAGIVIKDPGGGIAVTGDFHAAPTLLSLAGLLIILLLMIREIKGSMLIGMLITAILGIFVGVVEFKGVVSAPPSLSPTFLKLDISGVFDVGFISVLAIFLLMDMFDTIGTLIGVGQATGLMEDGKLPRAQQALFADAVGTATGALFGTSTVTSYIESTTGVRAGGRTGLTAVVVAALMLLATFFSPLVSMIGGGTPILDAEGNLLYTLYPVIAPVLILVGSFMAKSISNCDFDDLTEAIPAFLTIAVMAFTFSISNGLAAGFILYPVLKLLSGRAKEVSWLMYVLCGLLIAKYVFIG